MYATKQEYKNKILSNMYNGYNGVEAFKRDLKVGDVFFIPVEDIGIEYDNRLPAIQKFVVKKRYKNCVLLEHEHVTWKWTYIHKYCPDYMKLYMLSNTGLKGEDTDEQLC